MKKQEKNKPIRASEKSKAKTKMKKKEMFHPKKTQKVKKNKIKIYLSVIMATPVSVDPLSGEVQSSNITFSPGYSPSVFYVKNKDGNTGTVPTVVTDFCDIPPNGKKGSNVRGVNVFKGPSGDSFVRLKLTLTRENAADVITLCKNTLKAWKEKHPPISQSRWYESQFNLADGTKVFNATQAIDDPSLYVDYRFIGTDLFNCPGTTFAPLLYGEDIVEPWYISVTVPTSNEKSKGKGFLNENSLLLFDENGKRVKAKKTDSGLDYTSLGIPLENKEQLTLLTMSDFFQSSRWKCKSLLQLYTIEWKTSTLQNASQDQVLYPIFNFRTAGSIVFKKEKTTSDADRTQFFEIRDTIFNDALFKGIEAPKKRKRTDTIRPKSSVKRVLFPAPETEVVPDSDIEGDETPEDEV